MLLLTDDDVRTAFADVDAMREAIDAVEHSFAAAYAGDASAGSLLITHPPGQSFHEGPTFTLSVTWGAWPGAGAAGGRMMALRALDLGRSTVSADEGRYWRPIWSTSSGELVALVVDGYAEQLLVGAHVGVATRHLAREESRSVGLIGSGGLAGPCLEAVCATRPIECVKVYSPTARHRQEFVREWRERLNVDVHVSASAREACDGVDIVTLATSAHARQPRTDAVIYNEWIGPGTHVNSITSYEVDRALHLRARVVPASTVYLRDHGIPMEPTTSLLRRGEIPPGNLSPDLIEIVGRSLRVRREPSDVTLYVGPSIGFQHAAINRLVLDKARDHGVGLEWDPVSGAVARSIPA